MTGYSKFTTRLRQFYLSFLIIILLPLTVVCVGTIGLIHKSYLDRKIESLSLSGATIAARSAEMLKNYDRLDDKVLRMFADLTSLSIVLINSEGRLVASSYPIESDARLDYSFFSDVRSALSGHTATFQGADFLKNNQELFISLPIRDSQGEILVLRISQSLDYFLADMKLIYFIIALLTAFALIAALLFSRLLMNKIYKPLYELERGAQRFAKGDLKFRLFSSPGDELGPLSRILNDMASQLDERIHTILNQKSELDAVFSGMREGVIVVDKQHRVVKANSAALEMLGTVTKVVEGKALEEVVRNIDLQNFIRTILSDDVLRETEVFLHERREMYVQVYSSSISDAGSRQSALMIVLNDVTQLKQLELVRTDFVANVSHELKTPITSIQGFVETLLDGAMHSPEENKRFLEIIKRQTERLNNIFNDLLILAKLEKDSAPREVVKEYIDLAALIDSAVQVCQIKANQKSIRIDASDLKIKKVNANASLLEQALVNLVDNAIKYGPEQSEIKITSQLVGAKTKVSVIDRGMGIEESHQKRIFERFYRVDQARSRDVGGTGLGLSIVKHIALLHGGAVEVESVPNQGSTFSVLLPA